MEHDVDPRQGGHCACGAWHAPRPSELEALRTRVAALEEALRVIAESEHECEWDPGCAACHLEGIAETALADG